MKIRRWTIGAALLLTAACGDAAEEEIPVEVREARLEAARQACIALRLEEKAEENLAALGQVGPGAGDESVQTLVTRAAGPYARAYAQHAELRARALAYADSAANYAATPQDSARYAAVAAAEVRTPEAGTVEENVWNAYREDFSALRADEDHPCNWSVELEP